MQKNTFLIVAAFVGLSLLVAQQAGGQSVLVIGDFYKKEMPRTPLHPNGAIGNEQVKCNGGDQMVHSSFAFTKRNDVDPVPDITILKALHKTNAQGVTRTFDIQMVNNGPEFVNIRLTALCLNMTAP